MTIRRTSRVAPVVRWIAVAAALLAAVPAAAKRQRAPRFARPYLIGPDPIFVFTDASLFSTALRVNGVDIQLGNADGMGSSGGLVGPLGYPNLKVVNAYLAPGTNLIEIRFRRSPLFDRVTTRAPSYAAFVVRGRRKSDAKVSSKTTTELASLAADKGRFEVLHGATRAFVRGNHIKPQYQVQYRLKLGRRQSRWTIKEVPWAKCKLGLERPFRRDGDVEKYAAGSSGTLLLNGKKLTQTVGRSHKNFDKARPRPGKNRLRYEVTHLKSPRERFIVQLDCDMDNLLHDLGSDNLRQYGVGDFFNRRRVRLWDTVIEKPGTYSTEFLFTE